MEMAYQKDGQSVKNILYRIDNGKLMGTIMKSPMRRKEHHYDHTHRWRRIRQ